MPDVVIIGGGLSGLVAAYELEKYNIVYTLIEVKPQLGATLRSVQQAGFTLDSGTMFHRIRQIDDHLYTYLYDLDLVQSISLINGDQVVFNKGNQSLIDALKQRIRCPIMYRMAVSTLGILDQGRLSICMENGMLLDTRALIVATPARYTERMFHTMIPQISCRLRDYRYDTITRVSVAYKDGLLDLNTSFADEYPITNIETFSHMGRGGMIVQVSLRYTHDELPEDPVGRITTLMGWPLNPDADHIAYWPEADPRMWHDPAHIHTMATVRNSLPENIALIGSDYVSTQSPPLLDERIQQAIYAVEKITTYLG